jgi:hypothetical protein
MKKKKKKKKLNVSNASGISDVVINNLFSRIINNNSEFGDVSFNLSSDEEEEVDTEEISVSEETDYKVE